MTSQNQPQRQGPPRDPNQRVFHTYDYIDPSMERPVRGVYHDEDMTMLVEWNEPGKPYTEIHSHAESAHVFVILEGEGEALVGKGKWEKVKAGDFYVCPRNKVHNLRTTSKDKRLVWVCTHIVEHGQKYTTNNSVTENDD